MDDGRPQVGGGKPVLERTGDKRRTQCSSHLLSRQVNVDDMKEGWSVIRFYDPIPFCFRGCEKEGGLSLNVPWRAFGGI
eukprot:1328326-Amorphochlora_amoeboformis.AAC.1